MSLRMTVSPSEKAYQATNDSPEPILFSWEASTMPVQVPGYRPTAFVVIDSTKVNPKDLEIIEEILYGNESENSRIIDPLHKHEGQNDLRKSGAENAHEAKN